MCPRIISSALPTIRAVRKLAWVCGAFAAGVFLAVLLVPKGVVLWLTGGFVVLGFLGFAHGGYRRLRLVLLGWGVAAGLLCCALQEFFVIAPAEEIAGQELTVSCRVLEYPDIYEDYARVTVRLTEPGLPSVKCQIMDYDGYLEALHPGQELSCVLRFRSARIRYGEESDFYTSRGVFLRATLREEAELVSERRATFFPQELRRFVSAGSMTLFPADAAPFHTALLSGDKTALYEQLDTYNALSRAGLMHVTAVSGMHVSFLVGFVLLLFPNRRRSALLLLPLLFVFAAMTGFTPSVLRAVFMQLCLLLAPLLKRESDSITSLSLVLAILLLINPQSAASVSLQLSFAAMLGIVLFAEMVFGWMYERLSRLGKRAAVFLSASLGTSLGALAFTTPLMALHFGYVSLVAPLSNVLCLWLISTLFVGGYGVILLGLLSPALAGAAAWVLAWGDRFIFAVSRLLSVLPGAVLYTDNRSIWLWLAFVYALAVLTWLHHKRSGELRLTAPVSLAVLTLCLCLLLPYVNHSKLRITVLDVGQGSSALLEGGANAVMVDCGGQYSGEYPGEAAAKYLLSRNRSHLDALILTHLHTDHCNGVERLLALVDVDTIYLPAWPEDETHLGLRDLAAERGTELSYVTEDICLAADGWELKLSAPLGRGDENENGLFVHAAQGDFDILLGGDASGSQERRYVQQEGLRDVDVLVVNHHGSDTSSSGWALKQLKPKLALISVGYNTYGHPDADVIARLEAVGAAVYRSDQCGHLVVTGKE